jgi:hypothetical protein
MSNARLAARIAREGGAVGIFFDVEQYEGRLFNYRKQRDAGRKSWDAYADQARQRGREVMQAFQEGHPDLVVITTFGPSFALMQAGGNKDKLPDADYGLLAPFFDGMAQATRGRARLVDGFEASYSFREPARYTAAYRLMSEEVLPILASPKEYRRACSFGFGIWLDYSSDHLGWHVDDFTKNHFTPQALEVAARAALETSDEYVWIYTERLKWWSDETQGKPVKLPAPYAEALRRARGRTDTDRD